MRNDKAHIKHFNSQLLQKVSSFVHAPQIHCQTRESRSRCDDFQQITAMRGLTVPMSLLAMLDVIWVIDYYTLCLRAYKYLQPLGYTRPPLHWCLEYKALPDDLKELERCGYGLPNLQAMYTYYQYLELLEVMDCEWSSVNPLVYLVKMLETSWLPLSREDRRLTLGLIQLLEGDSLIADDSFDDWSIEYLRHHPEGKLFIENAWKPIFI